MVVADEAFPLRRDLMKPYPQRNLTNKQRIFNYRLSRARRVVENAFGILANRFRIFLSAINLQPEKVVVIVKAACVLHNFLQSKGDNRYIEAGLLDSECTDTHSLIPGSWRANCLESVRHTKVSNPAVEAKTQRDHLCEYFLSENGSVPWQTDMI